MLDTRLIATQGPQPAAYTGYIDAEGCRAYIRGRQDPDGGFCFYRTDGVDESNAPDTLAAVASLRLLGCGVPRRAATAAWLGSQQRDDGGYATLPIGWASVGGLRELGCEPARNAAAWLRGWYRRLAGAIRLSGDVLQSLARIVDLARWLGVPVDGNVRRNFSRLLEALASPTAAETPGVGLIGMHQAQRIAAACGADLSVQALEYARACEHPVYGFNITPTAVSTSLEALAAGTEIFANCATGPPRHAAAVRRFVSACQTPRGGFGRVPGALSRLDDTWHALRTLAALKSAERLHPPAGYRDPS